jgi:hypothetical protein
MTQPKRRHRISKKTKGLVEDRYFKVKKHKSNVIGADTSKTKLAKTEMSQ